MMASTRIFSEFIEINPAVPMKKGVTYLFIAMEDLVPGRRYVTADRMRQFTGGGARFQSGDILFARITPCLENGKIAQVHHSSMQTGFGSTEFFVFRNKQEISDPAYIFYLALTDIIRKPAEKSMKGASGRQRADIASVWNLDVPAPPLPTRASMR